MHSNQANTIPQKTAYVTRGQPFSQGHIKEKNPHICMQYFENNMKIMQ